MTLTWYSHPTVPFWKVTIFIQLFQRISWKNYGTCPKIKFQILNHFLFNSQSLSRGKQKNHLDLKLYKNFVNNNLLKKFDN